MATDGYGKSIAMSSHCFYLCLTPSLERQKWHIAIMDLEATVLHGVAARYSCIF